MLRRRLVILALAALLPLTVFAVGLVYYSVVEQQGRMRAEAVAQAERLLDHIERELRLHIDLLQILGRSPTLDEPEPDLATFQEVAERFADNISSWNRVILLAEGRQLVSTHVPFGTPLRNVVDDASYEAVLARREPVIGNFAQPRDFVPTLQQIAVRVPVFDGEGGIRFVLSALVSTQQLAQLVEDVSPPAGWRPFVVDANDMLIVNIAAPERVGERVGARAVEARAGGAFGIYEGRTAIGEDVVTAFRKSANTGWSAHVSIPLAIYNAPFNRLASFILAAAALAIALTALFGWLLRREFVQSRQEATHRERGLRMEALGRLTGGVAHDFNNLLMVILSSVELLQRRVQGPEVERYAGAIRKAAERGAGITRELLAFSRGDAKRAEIVDLGERVRAMLAMVRQSLPQDIAIEDDIPQTPARVRVDPIQLDLALLNIAVNARDAMSGSGRLRVSVARAPFPDRSGREGFVVRVSDTGGGVPPEALPHVFEPFFTTKEVGKGTGLGLSQVHGFAKASDGVADIESRVGAGTTVSIHLPEILDAEATIAATGDGEEPASTLRRGRVLLVEDDAAVRTATAEFLEQAGYEVRSVENAEQALALVDAGGIDILVSDIVMPGERDGIGLAKEVRRCKPMLPILLVSGYAANAPAAAALGIEVLAKPCALSSLDEAIGRHLGAGTREAATA